MNKRDKVWFGWEMRPHRLTYLNTWSQVVKLFGEATEPVGSGALLEEVCLWEWGERGYSLPTLPFPTLGTLLVSAEATCPCTSRGHYGFSDWSHR